MNETVSSDRPVHQADDVKAPPEESAKVDVVEKCESEAKPQAKNVVIIPLLAGLKASNGKSENSGKAVSESIKNTEAAAQVPPQAKPASPDSEQPKSDVAAQILPEPVKPDSTEPEQPESAVSAPELVEEVRNGEETIEPELPKQESAELLSTIPRPHQEAITSQPNSPSRKLPTTVQLQSVQVKAEEHSSDAVEPVLSVQEPKSPKPAETSLSETQTAQIIPSDPDQVAPSDAKPVLAYKEVVHSAPVVPATAPTDSELVKPVPNAAKPAQTEPEPVKPAPAEPEPIRPAPTESEVSKEVATVSEWKTSSDPEHVMNVDPEVGGLTEENLAPLKTCRKDSDRQNSVSVNPEAAAVRRTEPGNEPQPEENGASDAATSGGEVVKGNDAEGVDVGDGKENDASCFPNIYMKKCNANEMIKRLDEIDPGHKLRSLCKKGDADALEEFLKTKVDLNVVSDEGWTCLHEIITHECQFTEIARVLLSHGASVNTQDLHGDSPLHSCLLYHCTENIKLLLRYGADLELTNSSGRKPIHVANDEESLKLLLDHGANVNAADNMGNTCLHYAVVAKDKERVKLLLSAKHKSDVTVKNASGSTPLHLTSEPEIASLLLEAAADPNAVDLAGNSPLHLAVRGRHKEVVRHLLERKADPNLINAHGKVPASLARDREMKNILSGKASSPTMNGVATSTSMTMTPTAIQSRKRPYSPSVATVADMSTPTSAAAVAQETPSSILKKVRRVSNENGERTSRLRFSDVNEYNCIDGDQCLSKRVKVRPIYSEPTFSSDDEF